MALAIEELPLRKEIGNRKRYAITFRVSEYWKGHPVKTVVLYVLERRADCIGAQFEVGKNYVVFAASQPAKDYRLGNDFWYGWLDLLSEGQRIFVVDDSCGSTASVSQASDTIKRLGKGQTIE
jgi:hypothetical protein